MMPKHYAITVTGILAFSAYYTTINFANEIETYFKYNSKYLGGSKRSVKQVLGFSNL